MARDQLPVDDRHILRAAAAFAETWAELAPALPDNYACHMTCAEADTLAVLLRAAGQRAAGDSVLAAHAAHDDPGDGHYPHQFSGPPGSRVCYVCHTPADEATGVCPGPPE